MASFLLKAAAWRLYTGREKQDKLQDYVWPLLVSLLINHLLPVKAGDLARTGMLMRSAKLRWDEALHSVTAMRLLDLLVLTAFGGTGIVIYGLRASWLWSIPLLAGLLVCIGFVAAAYRLRWRFVIGHAEKLRLTLCSVRGLAITALTAGSWVMEGAVVYGVLTVLGSGLSPVDAVWANSMTIAGQVFHVTPGAVGTYETTMTAALRLLWLPMEEAYTAALLSHGYKFVFAYVFGAAAIAFSAVSAAELRGFLRRSTASDGEERGNR
jgi:uncharacterized membrane protein YbhN (UPF0104 family)